MHSLAIRYYDQPRVRPRSVSSSRSSVDIYTLSSSPPFFLKSTHVCVCDEQLELEDLPENKIICTHIAFFFFSSVRLTVLYEHLIDIV